MTDAAQKRHDEIRIRGALVNIIGQPTELKHSLSEPLLTLHRELRLLSGDQRLDLHDGSLKEMMRCIDEITEEIYRDEPIVQEMGRELADEIRLLQNDYCVLEDAAVRIAAEFQIREDQHSAEVASLRLVIDQRLLEHSPASPDLRAKVFALTGGKCAYCETEITADPTDGRANFVIEHVVPKSCGGPDHFSNYVPACSKCNAQKATGHVVEFIQRKLVSNRVEIAEAAE